MNIRQEFYKKLRECGICEDSAKALEQKGLLSEVACERFLIKIDFEKEKAKNKKGVDSILSELAMKYHKSEHSIKNTVYNIKSFGSFKS